METIIEILGPSISVGLTALVTAIIGFVVAYVSKWIPVPPEAQVRVTEVALKAIERVEEKARLAANKIEGPEKLKMALDAIDKASEKFPEIKKYSAGKLEDLVESLLKSRLSSDEVTPKNISSQSTVIEL